MAVSHPLFTAKYCTNRLFTVMRRLQLLFNFDSTAVRLPSSGHGDVTRAADPLAAVMLTSAAQQPGGDVGRRMIVARSNCSRIMIESSRVVGLVVITAL